MYNSVTAVTKISILLFYRRVFPREATTRRWRIILWTLGSLISGNGVAAFFGTAFQCFPVARMWNQHITGSCMNQSIVIRLNGVYNLITDIAILILPMPIVWQMRLENSKKIAVTSIFLLGGL